MSVLAMQKALACVLTDATLRDRFFADPEGTLSAMDLSERERASLLGVDRKRIAAHAHIVMEARFERALRGFPVLRRLLAPEIAELSAAYGRRFPRAAPPADEPALVMAFLMEQRATARRWPSYLADVARYEAKALHLGGTSANVGSARARRPRAGGFGPLSPESAGQWTPRRREGAEVLTFEHDVLAVARQVCAGKAPVRAARRPATLLLYFDLASYSVRSCRLTEAARRALELCDGRRSAAGVIAALSAELGQKGAAAGVDPDEAARAAEADARRALRAVLDAGAVELAPICAPT